MSMRNWLTKYSYLVRIVISITCMLCVPALLFGFGIIGQSYQEMTRKNEEYYSEATNTFMRYVSDFGSNRSEGHECKNRTLQT